MMWANTVALQNFILLFGALVTLFAIYRNYLNAKTRSTLQFFEEWVKETKNLTKANHIIEEWNPTSENIGALRKDENWPKVLFLLNKLESLAIGFHQNVYNKRMIRICFRTIVPRYFKRSETLIKCLREHIGDDTLCENFERMAKEWDLKNLP